MKLMYFFLLIIFSISLFSCKSEKTQKQVAEVDSLIAMNDSVLLQYNSLNSDSLQQIFDYLSNQSKNANNVIAEIHLDTAVSRLLTVHSGAMKALKTFFKKHKECENELKFSETQLKNLKNDISNELLSDDEFSKFINEERAAVIEQNSKIYHLTHEIKNQLILYKKHKAQIDSLFNLKPSLK